MIKVFACTICHPFQCFFLWYSVFVGSLVQQDLRKSQFIPHQVVRDILCNTVNDKPYLNSAYFYDNNTGSVIIRILINYSTLWKYCQNLTQYLSIRCYMVIICIQFWLPAHLHSSDRADWQ